MRTALILGGAGFIGTALARRLVAEGTWVRCVDIRRSPFETASPADDFAILDLRNKIPGWASHAPVGMVFDEVYQLACDMGGAGYIFDGKHDATVMTNNVKINANVAETFSRVGCGRLLYTSSSCVYDDAIGDPIKNDIQPIREEQAYPANPSNGYGWEKLFSERLYDAYSRNTGLNFCVTRFSTIYGPGSAFNDGREKAVAAICRKVIEAPDGGEVEVWGDGSQSRPLVYIDDLLDAMISLSRNSADYSGPLNIANTEHTTCDEIARKAIALSGKNLTIKHVPGPIGKVVLDMTTDRAANILGWRASTPFDTGLARTYEWIARQIEEQKKWENHP